MVGLADVERYEDGRASFAIAVAPALRGCGVGTALVRCVLERPEFATVVEFFGGVGTGNVASAALMIRSGFEQVTEVPDEEGFVYFAFRPDGTPCGRPWRRTLPGAYGDT